MGVRGCVCMNWFFGNVLGIVSFKNEPGGKLRYQTDHKVLMTTFYKARFRLTPPLLVPDSDFVISLHS